MKRHHCDAILFPNKKQKLIQEEKINEPYHTEAQQAKGKGLVPCRAKSSVEVSDPISIPKINTHPFY